MSAISISNLPLSTTSPTPLTTLQTYFKERAPEVQELKEALKSGNLAGAQQAYNDLVALGKDVLQKDNPFLRSDRAFDFNAIGGALQNGDLAGAQQAFTALQSTFEHKLPPVASPVATPSGAPATVVSLSNAGHAGPEIAPSSSNADGITSASENGVNVIA
jgi:hypothetical protein